MGPSLEDARGAHHHPSCPRAASLYGAWRMADAVAVARQVPATAGTYWDPWVVDDPAGELAAEGAVRCRVPGVALPGGGSGHVDALLQTRRRRLALHCPVTGLPFLFAETLGDPPPDPPLVWGEIFPDTSGDFAIVEGGRYAVLASLSKNYSLAQAMAYLTGHGWSVTYSWETGQQTRGQYPVDAWLEQLAPDTRDNHRWVYGEANRTGASTTLAQDPPWPLTLYHVAHVLRAVPAASVPGGSANLPDPASPGCPTIPSRVPPFLWGLAAGVTGVLAVASMRR
jgi:hypothetical protein